jgi:hypothetical protein
VNRDLVLATVALVLCGAAMALPGLIPAPSSGSSEGRASARSLERRAWQRLWLPALPAAIAFATLMGWRLQEPDRTDELLRPAGIFFALPFALIWLRALVRAIRAMRRPRVMPPAATLGLLRPRVVIDERLHGTLDAPALAAAVAHEEAHAAHLDPLRIWLAQLLTDVQWSSPWARRRFDRWIAALEMARDEEARLRGTRGEDLAAAVVAVAGMRPVAHGHAIASLTGAEVALMDRVRRLLSPVPAASTMRSRALWVGLGLSLIVAVVVGVEFGDSVLRALPFVTT